MLIFFCRYRHQIKSNAVLKELQYVLSLFQAPLLQLFQTTTDLIFAPGCPVPSLVSYFTAIKQMIRIFYALNCIDLPEFFEDHLNDWMTLFRKYLLCDFKYPELVGDEVPSSGHTPPQNFRTKINLDYCIKFKQEFASVSTCTFKSMKKSLSRIIKHLLKIFGLLFLA